MSLTVPALATLLAGCDPCAGTANCRTSDRVSYTGRVVNHATGHAEPGTVVSFAPTGRVLLSSDTITAVADGDGFFRLSAEANGSGEVVGTLIVRPAGRPGYFVENVTMRTSRVGGDGGDLGRLVSEPYIMFIAEVHGKLPSLTGIVPFATVTFTRTGGVAIDSDTMQTTTDADGRFVLAPVVKAAGVLEGTLTFSAPRFPRPYTMPVRIGTRYLDAPTHDVSVFNLGNSALLWVGEVYRRGMDRHTAGIRVDFRRTSGIAVAPSAFTATTTSDGLFPIQPTPLEEGELIGDVTVHPPPPFATFVSRGVHVHTHDDELVRLAGRFGYGPQAFVAVQFLYRTTMKPVDHGGLVVFRRTGGVQAPMDSSWDRINDLGAAKIAFATDAIGEVTGTLEARLGDAYGTEVIHDVRFQSVEDDVQRFSGVRLVGRWFPQIGQVVDGDSRKSIPGTRVTFKRVSGVSVQPDPYVVTPNADGYFGIRPQPLSDGEVVGNLTFEPPAPYRTLTVSGIRLRSSMDDTLRLIGAWFLSPSK